MSKHQSVDLGSMIEGIRRWVETESPTRDRAAVNRMIDLVQSDVGGLPVAVERVSGRDGFADSLVVRNEAAGHGAGILILSHIDTVHPIGTLSGPLPFRRDGDRLYGPGLFDMKGGAYLALEAFRQVAKAGSAKLPVTFVFTPDEEVGSPTSRHLIEAEAKLPVTFVFTPDEEVGSPTSRHLIEAEAKRARYVLVTEPARDGGKIVTARKGVGRFEVKTIGVPAHSGARHQDGRSAIKEMARQILAVEDMTDYARGVTTTVGTISGGTAPNVIPQHCHITIDLRVCDEAAGDGCVVEVLRARAVRAGVEVRGRRGQKSPPLPTTTTNRASFPHAPARA